MSESETASPSTEGLPKRAGGGARAGMALAFVCKVYPLALGMLLILLYPRQLLWRMALVTAAAPVWGPSSPSVSKPGLIPRFSPRRRLRRIRS